MCRNAPPLLKPNGFRTPAQGCAALGATLGDSAKQTLLRRSCVPRAAASVFLPGPAFYQASALLPLHPGRLLNRLGKDSRIARGMEFGVTRLAIGQDAALPAFAIRPAQLLER